MTLSELKKIAQSATKGFWFFNQEHGLHVLLIPTAEPHHIASEVKIADGKYIQAMQPQTALRMIGLIQRAEEIVRYAGNNGLEHHAKTWLKDLEEIGK